MEWFENWFETEYYHILYSNRNHDEAERFIHRLFTLPELEDARDVLDLACGKGRHSKILADEGRMVTGADISENSIQQARRFESENLRFLVHDMRNPTGLRFDAVLNLFTSFGYFEKEHDNLKVLRAVHDDLRPNGTFVLDFLNPRFVERHLVPAETKKINNIEFDISREIEDGIIVKTIRVKDPKKDIDKTYKEKVTAFRHDEMTQMLQDNGFEVKRVFGDYDLSDFNEENAGRMIFTAEKINRH